MEGKPHEDIRLMINGGQMMGPDTLKELFEDNKMEKISNQQIHILVLVPDIATTIEVNESLDEPQELAYYQRLGREIQMNCQDQCGAILDKIDFIYDKGPHPKPFVCVQGSSGMGKTQLAFTLGGEGREYPRPWFYWSLSPNVVGNQRVYKNFSSIAKAFNSMVQMDLRDELSEDTVLNCSSEFYMDRELWTYGFIIELLRYCCRENIGAEMIRVNDQTFTVSKCNQKAVRDVLSRMKQDRRVWPFFILDEMTPSGRIPEMKKKAAFQRNGFRACGLVVAVMGTDAKISSLVWQSELSRSDRHWWMSVVSNFPVYQSIPLGVSGSAKETTWQKVIDLYPVVKNIAEHSRGLFARYFVDAVVDYAMQYVVESETFALADLLDTAFQAVNTKTQIAKMYVSTDEGRDAQLMALSYTNVGTSVLVDSGDDMRGRPWKRRKLVDSGDDMRGRPWKRRKLGLDVGIESMHLHFANLVDEGITDVDAIQGDLLYRAPDKGGIWKPICQFPVIEDDVLLYLAVLGGKHFSAYYNCTNTVEYSTAAVFRGFRSRYGNRPHVNPSAFSYGFSEYENMIAHAIFCASRRNGVGGIAFNDFFSGLLGEFQDNYFQKKRFDVSALLGGYTSLEDKFARTMVPFLAPPNARWPTYILEAGGACKFGHLGRAQNRERLDCYTMLPKDANPLFICECKNLEGNLGSNIIEGLNAESSPKCNNWDLALVFCPKLVNFQEELEFPGTGIVLVDCETREVNWILEPEAKKKLVIILQTGVK